MKNGKKGMDKMKMAGMAPMKPAAKKAAMKKAKKK